jgi:hypothetical protein
MVTNDPAAVPAVSATAWPEAITAGTTPDILVSAPLRGVVTGQRQSRSKAARFSARSPTTAPAVTSRPAMASDQPVWRRCSQTPARCARTPRRRRRAVRHDQHRRSAVNAPTGPAIASLTPPLADGNERFVPDRITIWTASGSGYAAAAAAAMRVSGTVVGRTRAAR